MIHKRRAEDRGNDNRLLAFQDFRKEHREIDKAELQQERAERKQLGICALENCDKAVTQKDHNKCNKHTRHYYHPYFVLGQRDYENFFQAA